MTIFVIVEFAFQRRKLSTKSLPSTSSARQRSASVGRDKHLDTQVEKRNSKG